MHATHVCITDHNPLQPSKLSLSLPYRMLLPVILNHFGTPVYHFKSVKANVINVYSIRHIKLDPYAPKPPSSPSSPIVPSLTHSRLCRLPVPRCLSLLVSLHSPADYPTSFIPSEFLNPDNPQTQGTSVSPTYDQPPSLLPLTSPQLNPSTPPISTTISPRSTDA